ncbi:hypothetical protein ACH5RR_019336 [Cinchona calisaya]|uniref:Protein WUSCHEL n=1 Tax=Cinchona calisaya TaxID=153742 RepID=A0ABD2ZP27_9GENT
MDEGFCIKPRGGSGGGYVGGGNKCGRWNPTSEQVKVLTDLFRSGLRTPSTDQIQKISSQLSFYGKIESKNVFYWFQNHKARERQKRRRVVSSVLEQKQNHFEDKNSSLRHFREINHEVSLSDPRERVIETLQLFPLNSFSESETEKKLRFLANDYKGKNASFSSYGIGTDMDHPTLDLRLSS